MTQKRTSQNLLNVAIGIERRGHMFYDIMAKSSENDKARAVFEGLASMELVHLATFERMLEDAGGEESIDKLEDGNEYIDALVDNVIFTDDLITSDMAAQADSDVKAIDLGIAAEKDSILFYYELRDMLPENMFSLVNSILVEEKRHLLQLGSIKKNIADAR